MLYKSYLSIQNRNKRNKNIQKRIIKTMILPCFFNNKGSCFVPQNKIDVTLFFSVEF